MYYIALAALLATTIFVARFCVIVVAWIRPSWLRALLFWLVTIPLLIGTLCLSFSLGFVDLYYRQMPSFVIAAISALCAFVIALMGFAIVGFGRAEHEAVPRARDWRVSCATRCCIASLGVLIATLLVFDWELRLGLRRLKVEVAQNWERAKLPPVADADNAAVAFMELEASREVLKSWRATYAGLKYDQIDSVSDEMTRFREECRPAFEVVREGARRSSFHFPRDHASPDPLAEDDLLRLLRDTVDLFRVDIVAHVHRGETSEAVEGVRVLLSVAMHCDTDLRSDGHAVALIARGHAASMIELLLGRDPSPTDEVLLSLIDEQHDPRNLLPEYFAWKNFEEITFICDMYLVLLKGETEGRLGSDVSQLPDAVRQFGWMFLRLQRVRDELRAARGFSQIRASFAMRHDDPTATYDDLDDRLRFHRPSGTVTALFALDSGYGLVVSTDRDQKLINTMLAATLYRRRHGRYPKQVSDLVPEFLAALPIDLGWGSGPIGLRPIGDGVIVFPAMHAGLIDEEFKKYGTIREDTARHDLGGTLYLGEARDHVFSPHADG
jgi:hypothetical protein